ncbi:M20 family metallopeptidase [Microbacterium sp. 18062]|uniref:M20 family metallopeptidase n=1 Tax=Microbacterium sp. 18062 TaxID=2681410 RepID=UPI001F1EEC9D|nr:M20 family metallopeptidase [Microbacterium sp. 18062]
MTMPSRPGDALLTWSESILPAMIDDIRTLVECESPSSDLAAVARSADAVAAVGAHRLGIAPERIVIDGCTHLRWRVGSPSTGTRLLLLAHHDTVWPVGSLVTRPFRLEADVLRGPGCFDMITGLVMGVHALSTVDPLGEASVTLLVTGDEEIGSPSSRALIEREARGCAAAFVLEAAADGGALKLERKGVSRYRVEVTGRAAHAGLEPERGINATVEMARQIEAVSAFADPAVGTTVTPTIARAGTSENTVAASASVAVDVRARTVAEQSRVDAAIRGLTPTTGAEIVVHGGINRLPLERVASAALWRIAGAEASGLGIGPLHGVAVGGASDGNFTAGAGVPTLDGLGAVGGGAHADDEHVVVSQIPPRTALLVALLRAGGAGVSVPRADGCPAPARTR